MVLESKQLIFKKNTAHDINIVDYHNFISNFFKNCDYLRKIEVNMKYDFPISTKEVMVQKFIINSTEKNSKTKSQEATCSKMLRCLYLYNMIKTSSKKVFGECCLMDNYLDRNSILCGVGSFCSEDCCIPIHDKCVRNSGWVKNNHFCCCRICMTGTVEYNEEGYFKCIKFIRIFLPINQCL